MTSSNGFDSKPSIRSSCLCSRSKKASTRRAHVLTMPSRSKRASETSSMAGSSVKSGMGGGSVLPLSFPPEEPLDGVGDGDADRCCAPAGRTSRPVAAIFPCSGAVGASSAARSSSGSMSSTSLAPSSCTLHLASDLSNSRRSPCLPLPTTTTGWPGDNEEEAEPGRRAPGSGAASAGCREELRRGEGTASKLSGPSIMFSPLVKRTVHNRSCWSSSSRNPCLPFISGMSCKPRTTTFRPGISGVLPVPLELEAARSLWTEALRCWRRRIHSSSSVRLKL
mmetsp:Transcript_74571/g.230474  ORF Transcript_74571/g.230474 Transcript_74571/m.230474 type:complete len:280 (-) Transcript_74571:993-1832(-)